MIVASVIDDADVVVPEDDLALVTVGNQMASVAKGKKLAPKNFFPLLKACAPSLQIFIEKPSINFYYFSLAYA